MVWLPDCKEQDPIIFSGYINKLKTCTQWHVINKCAYDHGRLCGAWLVLNESTTACFLSGLNTCKALWLSPLDIKSCHEQDHLTQYSAPAGRFMAWEFLFFLLSFFKKTLLPIYLFVRLTPRPGLPEQLVHYKFQWHSLQQCCLSF